MVTLPRKPHLHPFYCVWVVVLCFHISALNTLSVLSTGGSHSPQLYCGLIPVPGPRTRTVNKPRHPKKKSCRRLQAFYCQSNHSSFQLNHPLLNSLLENWSTK